jgi:hypothetical protein
LIKDFLMRTARFWTGVAMLSGLAIMIITALPGRPVATNGTVEGMVMYQGRPACDGMIFFYPEEPKHRECASAHIDKNGYFECDPTWERDRADRIRYHVTIVLGPRDFPTRPRPTGPGENPKERGGDRLEPGRGGELGPVPRVVRASMTRQDPGSPGRDEGAGGRWRPATIGVIHREVSLGPGPAHVEFDLRD